ncbi:hypothetical protein CN318_01535 [Bacillus cereus]|uniref:AAA family ATPase n=1 Tax=Bacillus thuringiensis TaxID=1428 RepID=UPI000BFA100B|nr:AAA family ATPase [Bacillus thuringiensis]PFE58305.1 hypothetical protein CN318_01535 [Bacillus cereus]PFN39115.1 hypothetical protein COJ56_18205 [Bacillus thuringiensis]
MKLLYLWCYRYKKLYNFQMNFGSEYVFEFEGDTLNVRDNDLYLKDFFNINKKQYLEGEESNNIKGLDISVIVGENGVGKTTVLQLLQDILVGNHRDSSLQGGEFDGDYFLIYEEDKKVFFENNLHEDLNIQYSCKGIRLISKRIDREKYNLIFFSNILDIRLLQMSPHEFFERVNYLDISTNYLSYKAKENIRFLNQEVHNQILFLKKYSHLIKEKKLLSIPQHVSLYTYEEFLDNYLESGYFSDGDVYDLIEKMDKDLFRVVEDDDFNTTLKRFLILGYFTQISISLESIENGFMEVTDESTQMELWNKIFVSKFKSVSEEGFIGEVESIFMGYLGSYDKELEVIKTKNRQFLNLYASLKSTVFTEEADYIADDDKVIEGLVFELYNDKGNNFLVENYGDFFSDTDVFRFSWHELSSGEYSMLTLFSRFNITEYELEKKDNIIILIDEGDLYFHPQWQKDWIFYFIELVNIIFDANIQLILTTHSPFILSDIPTTNVTFMSKDSNKGFLELGSNRTFAGNIVELFTNSFFLQDGLVGKFAKYKINTFTEFLLTSKPHVLKERSNYISKFIDSIGEPLVRNKLQEIFNSRIEIYNTISINERIAKLEEEIQLLKMMREEND